MKFGSHLKSTVLTFVLIVVCGVPAFAQEEPAVIKALYDTFAELGGERPSHESLTVAGDGSITISGAKVLLQNYQQGGEDVRQEMTADEVVIGDVKEVSAGLYEAGTMTMKNAVITTSTPEVATIKMAMPIVQLQTLFIRSPALIKTALDRAFAQSALARSTSVPLVTISFGEQTIDIHDIKITWDGDPITFMGGSTFKIGGIELPASTLDDLGMQPSLQELGYEKLAIGMDARASMQMPTGNIDIEGDSKVLARDMGAFSMSGSIGGLQPALFEAAQAVRESANSIDMNAMMAMLQTVTISHISLRYDDASLAEKLLQYYEKLQKKSREELAGDTATVSEFGLLGLNSPDFSRQVKDALKTFLTKPGWIQIELRPEAPIAASQVMPLLGAPAEIVKLFNVQVTAGQAGQ